MIGAPRQQEAKSSSLKGGAWSQRFLMTRGAETYLMFFLKQTSFQNQWDEVNVYSDCSVTSRAIRSFSNIVAEKVSQDTR